MTLKEISDASGIPQSTVTKIFNGETANPGFDTVCAIIATMGGSIDEVLGMKSGEQEMNAIAAIKEIYENRIKDIKESNDRIKESNEKHIASLARDKRILFIVVAILGIFILGVLTFDLLNGGVGYVRY